MGGGRKKQLCSDRGTRRRYFASGGAGGKKDAGSRSYSSDRSLIPRIKEYLAEYGSGVVDVGEMALALQDQHSEYTRKKRVAFRNLVAKVYKSLQEGASEEGRLQQREMEHLKRRADSAHQTAEEEGVEISDSECSFSDLTSDSDAEFEANLPEISNMMNDSLLHMYGSNATPVADSQVSHSHSQSHSNGESPFQDGTDSASVVDLSSGTLVSELQRATNSGTTADEKDEVAGSFFMDTSGDLDDKRRRKLPSPAYVSTVRETSSNHSSYEERSKDGNSPVQSTSECLNDSAALNGVVPGPRPLSGSGGDDGVSELASAAEKPPAKSPKRVTFAPDVAQFVGDSSIKTSGEESKSLAFKSVSVKRDRHGQERERRGKEREGRGREREGRGRKHREHGSKRRKMEKEESERVKEDKSMDSAVKASLGQKRNKEFAMEKSTVRFSDVGGCQSCLEEVCRLLLHLRHSEVFKHLGVKPPQGFLLHGPPGSGKTLLAQAIAGELDLPLLRLAATEVVSGVSGESEETIRSLFQQAKEHAPCVLFIDEIDAICPKRETAHREMERRIVTQLLSCLDDLNQSSADSHVLVIGATNRPDSLDPALRRAGRFDREISLGIPDEQARESILRVLCRPLRLEAGLDFVSLAHNTPGFVGADLLALVREASLSAVSRVIAELSAKAGVDGSSPESMEVNGQGEGSQTIPGGSPVGAASSSSSSSAIQQLQMAAPLTGEQLQAVCITTQDFKVALTLVQPSAKREGFATVPDTTWEDVGALEGVREELSMAILAPVHYPRQFASLGLATPPGILLAGPPGCGKTLLAKAIANESGINFISVKGPELLNMYVGESERAVRQVFQRARNSSPCVIFFDELDALCPKRSEMAETSASARVVNQLLTEMDGLEVRKQVFIMAATNRPDIIDPAVLRPGRLDKVLYVGLPSESDRAAILKTLTKGGKPQLHRDVDLDSLASDDYCEGFSGADLSALVREAAVLALQEYMKLQPLQKTASDQSNYSSIAEECVVSMKNFKAALQKVKPSVSEKEKAFYNQIAERFGR